MTEKDNRKEIARKALDTIVSDANPLNAGSMAVKDIQDKMNHTTRLLPFTNSDNPSIANSIPEENEWVKDAENFGFITGEKPGRIKTDIDDDLETGLDPLDNLEQD